MLTKPQFIYGDIGRFPINWKTIFFSVLWHFVISIWVSMYYKLDASSNIATVRVEEPKMVLVDDCDHWSVAILVFVAWSD